MQPVVTHAPPEGDGWSTHPVDRFAAAAQHVKWLTRAPGADRWARPCRLRYALTGLPPTRAELAAFEQDACPDAFEREVDRLLASPAYGERLLEVAAPS